MPTVIESIATANPKYCVSQVDAARNMQRVAELSAPLRKRVPHIYQLSAIERRFTCVPDYAGDPDREVFDPSAWSVSHLSSTGRRNEHYRDSVTPIAEEAARAAMAVAQVEAASVTHVVVASCTGFFAPGLDIHLVKSLRLPSHTQRTLIGFMGCYAAFNALRVADSFCKADPAAVVLVVCAELCSLHFQIQSSIESVVVNSLFADGSAAAIVRARPADSAEIAGKLVYDSALTLLDDDSMEHMSWSIGDTGFTMGLSPRVPDVLARALPPYVERLLCEGGVGCRGGVDFWAIHPGGRQIVDKAREVLGLSEEDVEDSLSVLREYGNMSSPTVLYILQRIMARPTPVNGARGIAMAFGPGLTIEGCLLTRQPAR